MLEESEAQRNKNLENTRKRDITESLKRSTKDSDTVARLRRIQKTHDIILRKRTKDTDFVGKKIRSKVGAKETGIVQKQKSDELSQNHGDRVFIKWDRDGKSGWYRTSQIEFT